MNFENDNWDHVDITMAWDTDKLPTRVQMVNDSAGWRDIKPTKMMVTEGHLKFHLEQPLAALDFMAVAFMKSE